MGRLFHPAEMNATAMASMGLVIALVIISLGVHEAAHGWVAYKRGDPTARDLGRVTLNPLVHIDPFLTIILPLLLVFTTGFIFGGAKPVPVAFHNLRRPYRDMALVALAGPLSNLLIATILALFFKLLLGTFGVWKPGDLGPDILVAAIGFNLLLAAFNLIPIPPLDGSRVMAWLLPPDVRRSYVQLERIGMFLIFGLLILGVLRGPILQMMEFMFDMIWWLLSMGGTW